MADEAVWSIEEHTLAKHEILRKYLNAWFPILSAQGFNRRVIFLDGFAGPGIYRGGEPGSPIVALRTLIDHEHFYRMSKTEFVFIFVEKREDRFKNLQQEVKSLWTYRRGGKPGNVRIDWFNAQFADVAAKIAHETRGDLAPTLAFIDPFGWSGIPMATIRDLLVSDKCEVLLTFMFDSIKRFANDERLEIKLHFLDLFGMNEEEYRRATQAKSDASQSFWPDLYMTQLRKYAAFTYTSRFALKDLKRNRVVYHLVHGTRHIKGLEVMKNATWSLDPFSGRQFAGFIDEKEVLFTPEADLVPLRSLLLAKFLDTSITFETMKLLVLEQTVYKTTHLREVLKELEKEGRLECQLSRKRKRLTYPEDTQIRILPTEQIEDPGPTQSSLF